MRSDMIGGSCGTWFSSARIQAHAVSASRTSSGRASPTAPKSNGMSLNCSGARVSPIDGIRADYPDGWGLVRCSNTTPSLVLRFDANDATALARIQDTFRAQILAVDPALKLPF